MQTHPCICMINTEFIGPFLAGAACHQGGLGVKGVRGVKRKGCQKDPFLFTALNIKLRICPSKFYMAITNTCRMCKT